MQSNSSMNLFCQRIGSFSVFDAKSLFLDTNTIEDISNIQKIFVVFL